MAVVWLAAEGRVMAEAKHPVRPVTVSAEELTFLSASRHPSLIDEDSAVFKVDLMKLGQKPGYPCFLSFSGASTSMDTSG